MGGMNRLGVEARRPRSSAAERAQWARRYYQSGLGQREFAARHRLRLSTLQRWVRQHPRIAGAFTELKLPALSQRWAVEWVRGDGSILRLAHDAPGAWLQHLVSRC
jgi:transposase-like protein